MRLVCCAASKPIYLDLSRRTYVYAAGLSVCAAARPSQPSLACMLMTPAGRGQQGYRHLIPLSGAQKKELKTAACVTHSLVEITKITLQTFGNFHVMREEFVVEQTT